MKKIHYKGYTGSVEYSDVDKVYYGKVLYVKDLISYEGKNIKELKKDFKHAVDIYLEICAIEKMTDVLSSFRNENNDTDRLIFKGTRYEWDNLSDEERKSYLYVKFKEENHVDQT